MSLFTGLRLISDRVLDLVYPSLCVYCGKSLLWQDNNILCSDCSGLLNRIDKTSCWFCSTPLGKYSQRQKECSECRGNKLRFTRVVAACSYNDVARELIHAYKFGNMKYVYRLIADYMYDKFIQEYSETHFNYILPVPLHRKKLCERGYNQSALIASVLAEKTGLTFSEDILLRQRYTLSQSMLSSEDRKKNLTGAFDVSKPLNNASILLVDDVFTTGSTISECADTLRSYGAGRVYAIVFAR